MAHRHSRGQILVEALYMMIFLSALLLLMGSHLSWSRKQFNKTDMIQEVSIGEKRTHREK